MTGRLAGAGSDGRTDGGLPGPGRAPGGGLRRDAGRVPDGVIEAASVAEAVAGADAVVVMVATPDQLEQVLAGAADTLADGQTVVVMSTVGPEAVVAAAARLAATGCRGGGRPGVGRGRPGRPR